MTALNAQVEQTKAEASGSPGEGLDAADESLFKSVTSISHTIFELVSSLGQLASLEAVLALKTIPRLIEARLAVLFFGAMGWLSFGVLCSITVFELTHWMLAAATTFFILQMLAIFGCQIVLAKLRHRLTLPQTREVMRELRLSERFGENQI